jgi:hypothetical protein
MSTISKPYTHSSGQVIASAEVNSNFDTIYNDYNGSISNANIAANAAIADTKLGTISTAGKVNTTALTTTSQAAGDILYNNGSGWVRLAKGTANYYLHMNSGATAPEWVAFASAAEVLTGTDATKPVTPSTVVSHQGVVKGWVAFDGTTQTITDSYNVDTGAGITENSAGDYTIPWDSNFGTANGYVVFGSGFLTADPTVPCAVLPQSATALAAATARVECIRTDTTAPVDANLVTLAAIGDRA